MAKVLYIYGVVIIAAFVKKSAIYYSNLYFYLSLPVFSHWQGRLDLRVMILGCMRDVTRSGVREADPGRLDDTQLPEAMMGRNSLLAAVKETGGIMVRLEGLYGI